MTDHQNAPVKGNELDLTLHLMDNGNGVYALNERGTSVWSVQVQPGLVFDDEGVHRRTPDQVLSDIAHRIGDMNEYETALRSIAHRLNTIKSQGEDTDRFQEIDADRLVENLLSLIPSYCRQ